MNKYNIFVHSNFKTMNWAQELISQTTMVQAVIVISVISSIGLGLGKLKVAGVSLGITFVFFTGIIAGHFGIKINPEMLNFAQNFGLILFVYALGLQVGPGFLSSFKKGGVRLNMLGLAVIALGLFFTLILYWTTEIPLYTLVGLLSGAVTNTPALGAAQQALLQINPGNTEGVANMALACAITYPLGVIGVILAIVFLKKLYGRKTDISYKNNDKSKTYVAEYMVCNPAVYNKSIKDVATLIGKRFVITRVWREGKVSIPTSDTLLQHGDHLLIVSVKGNTDSITALFGEQENVDWNNNDIDWNAIDSQLISRRILVTDNNLNGVKLGALRLRNLYGINITRVNRVGIDLLASPDLRLQIGDKLTIVGEKNAVDTVGKILGDEIKRLDNPNLIAVFVGIALGVILGSIPLAIPGISMPIKLGIAGGPIIVGILMGAFGPRFHVATYTTQSANLMIRQLGIVIYLAGLGLTAGEHFFETVFRPEGVLWIGIGFLLTIVPVLIVGYISSKSFKTDYSENIGMLCGCMANPMALSFANTTVEDDVPSVAYATVYPLSMFIRVISAQLILMIFS